MTKERVIQILVDYVNNDYDATFDSDYIRDALSTVASKEEIVEIGFGWLYPEEC